MKIPIQKSLKRLNKGSNLWSCTNLHLMYYTCYIFINFQRDIIKDYLVHNTLYEKLHYELPLVRASLEISLSITLSIKISVRNTIMNCPLLFPNYFTKYFHMCWNTGWIASICNKHVVHTETFYTAQNCKFKYHNNVISHSRKRQSSIFVTAAVEKLNTHWKTQGQKKIKKTE